jgi:NAD(P)-dependent dehydrogenase (short-subunit alcohol dehydrogenase family)
VSDISNAKHNQLDIVCNNAEVPCKTTPSIVDLHLAVFGKVMDISVRGVMTGIKHVSRVMIPRRTGSILCTASVTGLIEGLSQHTYSVSKSTVIGIVKSLAAELCKYGIWVNCISPLAIPTPFVMDEMSQIFPDVDDRRLMEMVDNAAQCLVSDDANCQLPRMLLLAGIIWW